jgi:hypothetical protein
MFDLGEVKEYLRHLHHRRRHPQYYLDLDYNRHYRLQNHFHSVRRIHRFRLRCLPVH